MQLVVADMEPIRELVKIGLAADFFGLGHQFAVVDVCLDRSCVAAESENLRGLGMVVTTLEGQLMGHAVQLARAETALSIYDAMSVVLAGQHDGTVLANRHSAKRMADLRIAAVEPRWIYDSLTNVVPGWRLKECLGRLKVGSRGALTREELDNFVAGLDM